MNIPKSISGKVNNPFVSLNHSNFRYYWIGMCVSLIGTWMQNIAQPWLAYSLTNSPFLLSLIGTLQYTPIMLFSLFAGVFIDKHSKKKILICTQAASLCITLMLAILVVSGKIQYWHIVIMATLLGVVNTFDMPCRQSFIIELVGKEDLTNAIALNSMSFNLARIIGPSIAGLVMGFFGIASCFFVNAISYAAVLISLFFIKVKPLHVKSNSQKETHILNEVKEGLKYIYHNNVLFYSIIVMAIVGTFAPNYNVLVPIFARDILGSNEAGFGILMSFMGIGSFIGAMSMASLSNIGPKRITIYLVPLIVATFLCITGFTDKFVLTGLSLAMLGLFFIFFTSSANSTLQINSSNEYRGRVMSVYTLVFAGSTPIGNLYAGIVTEHFGSRIGFFACGAIIILLLVPLIIYRSTKRF